MPPPRRPPIPGRRRIADPPRGRIEEVSEEPSEQPEAPGDPGDDDGGGDGGGDDDPDPDADPDPDVDDPIPNPNPNAEADGEAQVGRILTALERLAENAAGGNRPMTSKAKLRDPDPFDGRDPKKLRGFLLQCKLNFRARPEYFRDDSAKVLYLLSFLKEPALEYFEPFLVDDTLNEPAWLTDFEILTEELYIYFGPYDQQADAEIELEQLVMKDSHKATKFFIDFYRISAMLDHNESSLYRKAYTAMPKRIKDEMVHFDKPRNLDELRDLIQKIDQRYWERRGEITREARAAPVTEAKSDKSARAAPNNDRRQGQNSGNSNSTPNTNAQSSGKGKEKEKPKGNPSQGQPKKPDLTEKLGKDGKLTQQERQRRQDNNLCLFCGQAGHRVRECPRSTAARAAKASDGKAPEPKAEATATASEPKK
jgi:hypothetical protein